MTDERDDDPEDAARRIFEEALAEAREALRSA